MPMSDEVIMSLHLMNNKIENIKGEDDGAISMCDDSESMHKNSGKDWRKYSQ